MTSWVICRWQQLRDGIAWSRLLGVSLAVVLVASVEMLRAPEKQVMAAEALPVRAKPRSLASSGRFEVLTYNVAGLPGIISSSSPSVNTPQVSPLLNRYDLVLAQEDFAYHAELTESARHRYQTSPRYPKQTMFGDGLAVLSQFPVEYDVRVRWRDCNGYLLALSDCFAEKGFSVARLVLGAGATLTVVNLHADAGHNEGDVLARRVGFQQLANYIHQRYPRSALLVAGDTNLNDSDPRDQRVLQRFLADTKLKEVCREFKCWGDNLDRVFYRSSRELALKPLGWQSDPRFVDPAGQPLSDHLPMAAKFAWSRQSWVGSRSRDAD